MDPVGRGCGPLIDPTAYIYIYIYGKTPPGGYLLSKNFIFPSFIVKHGQKKPTNSWRVFACFQVFFFFLLSAFFHLSVSSLPLLFRHLEA